MEKCNTIVEQSGVIVLITNRTDDKDAKNEMIRLEALENARKEVEWTSEKSEVVMSLRVCFLSE